MTPASVRVEGLFNRFSDAVGWFSAILLLLLILNVFYDVVMRYLFNNVSIGMQELEWHLYSMIFLFGVAYTLKADGHVRVDIIYERLSVKHRAMIDILGTLIFIWPFCLLVAIYGIDFAHNAFVINEQSGDPGGLPYRWIIKSMISIAFICVLISSIGFMLRAWNAYRGLTPAHNHDSLVP
jgi:TRAP-type mannitol/chloroaromatic compound transport system permease small subunit